MEYSVLKKTDVQVSKLCLGTMTFGEQNTESEAHEQLNYAISKGINFIDTAEMYPVPPKEETQGLTEKYIGTWLAKRKNRDKLVVATKVLGPSNSMTYVRNGPKLNADHIRAALEASLKRLQTDYIDLYQLHWPDRKTNFFGKRNFEYDPNEQWQDNTIEIIRVLNELKKEGKIRYWGLSNETAWGAMHYIRTAELLGLDGPVTVQNPYNLLNRTYEIGLAEISIRENIGLLAYSPLAFGVLTGKYLHGEQPKDGRLTLFPRFGRYSNEQALKATERYEEIAVDHGLNMTHMALAFINSRTYVTSNIVGATKMIQLKENLGSLDLTLSEDVLNDINQVCEEFPNPAP